MGTAEAATDERSVAHWGDLAGPEGVGRAGTTARVDALIAGHAGDDSTLDGDGRLPRAVARHLDDFWTWRSVVMRQDLDDDEAVEVAVTLLTAIASDAPSD